jgi:hypothetical protein
VCSSDLQDIPSTVFDPNIPADYTPLSVESTLKANAAWLGVGTLPVIGIVAQRRRARTRRRKGVTT